MDEVEARLGGSRAVGGGAGEVQKRVAPTGERRRALGVRPDNAAAHKATSAPREVDWPTVERAASGTTHAETPLELDEAERAARALRQSNAAAVATDALARRAAGRDASRVRSLVRREREALGNVADGELRRETISSRQRAVPFVVYVDEEFRESEEADGARPGAVFRDPLVWADE
jgi:hypothetical protein